MPGHDVRVSTQFAHAPRHAPDMSQTWCAIENAVRTYSRHASDMMSYCQRISNTPQTCPRHDVRVSTTVWTHPWHDVRLKTQSEPISRHASDIISECQYRPNRPQTYPRHDPDKMLKCKNAVQTHPKHDVRVSTALQIPPDMMGDYQRGPNLSPDKPQTWYPSVNTGRTHPRHALNVSQTWFSSVITQSEHIPTMMFDRQRNPNLLQSRLRHDVRVLTQFEHTPDKPLRYVSWNVVQKHPDIISGNRKMHKTQNTMRF